MTVEQFKQRARRHEALSVLFLGGSLTFGAGASDPETTSYRGLMMRWLREEFPETPFRFHDAAIGGTGSMLALFRLERDVLPCRPDLVFLDFTVNDGLETADARSLAAYEEVLRAILQRGAAVLPVLTCTRAAIAAAPRAEPPRLQLHRQLVRAHGLVPADTLLVAAQAVTAGVTTLARLYPETDPVHPTDEGYTFFFEAVRRAFLGEPDQIPAAARPRAPLHAPCFPQRRRARLVDTPLPAGWKRACPYRTAMWLDGLSSRWMDDVACAMPGALPLATTFRGSFVAIFGERSATTPPFRVWVDDIPRAQPGATHRDPGLWCIDTTVFERAGNLFAWTVLADGLAEGEHRLKIEPVFSGAAPAAELRVESICSAGKT